MEIESEPKDQTTLVNTEENIDYWSNKDFISDEVKSNIKKADIIFLPIESWRGMTSPIFSDGTLQLLNYIKKNSDENIITEICINPENYQEILLHSNYVRYGTIFVKYALVPTIIGLIVNYTYSKLGSDINNTKAELELIIQIDEKETKKLKYNGPANALNDLQGIIEGLNKK